MNPLPLARGRGGSGSIVGTDITSLPLAQGETWKGLRRGLEGAWKGPLPLAALGTFLLAGAKLGKGGSGVTAGNSTFSAGAGAVRTVVIGHRTSGHNGSTVPEGATAR